MNEPKYRRTSETLHSAVGDDIVALHVRMGHCYGMEDVTADVWRLLEQDMSVAQICEQLQQLYEVDDARCRAEVGRLIETMVEEKLIEPVGDDSGAKSRIANS
jgi:hypothetical protein